MGRRCTNLFLSETKVFEKGLRVRLYEAFGIPMSSEEFKHRALGTCVAFLNSQGVLAAPYPSEPDRNFIIALNADHLPPEFKGIDGKFDLIAINYITLLPNKPQARNALGKLLYQSIRRNLIARGFWKLHRAYNTFFFPRYEQVIAGKSKLTGENVEVELFRGLTFRVEIFENGQVGIIIDPTSTAIDHETLYQRFLKGGNRLQEGVNELRRKIKTLGKKDQGFLVIHDYSPRTSCYLIDIDLNRKVTDKVIELRNNRGNVVKKSVFEYHSEKHPEIAKHIDLDEPLAIVRYGKDFLDKPHASSLLKDVLTTDEVPSEVDKERALSPNRRVNLTKRFLKSIIPILMNGQAIALQEDFADEKTFKFGTFNLPSLMFKGNNVQKAKSPNEWADIRKRGLRTYGPYEGLDRLVPFIVHPPGMRKIAKKVYDDIEKVMNIFFKCILGKPTFKEISLEFASETDKEYLKRQFNFALVIIPEKGATELYEMLKQTLPIPNQMIRASKIPKGIVSAKEFRRYKSSILELCAGIYGKCGGMAWILGEMLDCDCYIGVDVGGKRARYACYAYVFDNRGKYVGTGVGEARAQKGESIDENRVKQVIIQAVTEYKRKQDKKPNRIVIHRDGEVTYSEIRGLEAAIAILKQEKLLNDDVEYAVINIKKRVPFRIYTKREQEETINYWESGMGSYYPLSNNQVVLCTTGRPEHRRGFPTSLLIEIAHWRGNFDVIQLTKDIYYLSHLHIGSISTKTRLPVTTLYAEKEIRAREVGAKRISIPL